MDIFKRLLNLAKPHTTLFIISVFCGLLVGGLQSSLAYLVKNVMDDIFVAKNMMMLKLLPLAVILIFLAKGVCSYVQIILMSFIGQRVIADLRYRLYEQMQKQSLAFFSRNSTGVLMSRITNDVHSIQGAVSDAVTNLIKEPFTLIFLVGVIFYRDWQLAIIAMLVFPLTVYPIAKFGKKMRKVATRNQETMGDLNTILQETISGARIVKAFCMETRENQRFAKVNEKLMRLAQKTVSISAMSSPFMEFLGGLGIAAVVLYGGYRVIQGYSTPGTFFSFLTAVIMLYQPIKHLTNINNTIQKGIAGAQRVFEIIDLDPDIVDRSDAVELGKIKDKIELSNVSFAYDETPILNHINLTISAGEVIAFVGMSGGGKTTLVNLIPRFYDVTAGQILIDGHDIRDVTLLSLRSQIGIVTQQTILFNDTVRNNIAYGSHDCSEEDILAAAGAANAHDFIMNLPEAYDTVIGELGTKLSGGERQRISIARALLKNAPILILDEATSALDTEAEREVQEALERLMKGRTTFVIAHRLSTIRNADRIVVLVKGEIVEEGSHEELLVKRGEYFKLYQLQFKDDKVEEEVRDK